MKKLAVVALAAGALMLAALPVGPGARAARPATGPALARRADVAAQLSLRPAVGAGRLHAVRAADVGAIRPVRVAIRSGAGASPAPRARVAAKASRAGRTAVPAGGTSTIASWYQDRPAACWDRRGRHAFPSGLRLWTAHRSLPCGTAIVVSGPVGRVTVRVWDRGPYVAGRGLDLSADAFRGACGSTARGLCRVRYGTV